MLPARLATAAVAIPFLLWLIFWAPFTVYRGVVLLFTLVAVVEYFQMAFATRPPLQRLGIVSGALVAVGMAGNPPESAVVFTAGLMAVVTIGLMSCLIGAADPAAAVTRFGHMLIGVIYAGAFIPHFIWLRVNLADSGPAWVLFVLAVAMGGDTGGYFAGRFFGKHLLMPSVSPKKTLEGSAGAVAGNVLAGVIIKVLLLPILTWREVVLLSLLAGPPALPGPPPVATLGLPRAPPGLPRRLDVAAAVGSQTPRSAEAEVIGRKPRQERQQDD